MFNPVFGAEVGEPAAAFADISSHFGRRRSV